MGKSQGCLLNRSSKGRPHVLTDEYPDRAFCLKAQAQHRTLSIASSLDSGGLPDASSQERAWNGILQRQLTHQEKTIHSHLPTSPQRAQNWCWHPWPCVFGWYWNKELFFPHTFLTLLITQAPDILFSYNCKSLTEISHILLILNPNTDWNGRDLGNQTSSWVFPYQQ